jgi:subtilisin family serine protease
MRVHARTFVAFALLPLAACSDRSAPSGIATRATLEVEVPPPVALNVLLVASTSDDDLARLRELGTVFDALPEIGAVIVRTTADRVDAIRALPFVALVERDERVRPTPLITPIAVGSFTNAQSTWNLDAAEVTGGPGVATRVVPYTGAGVYVGVIDSGLLPTWRAYFPEARIDVRYATTFVGGASFESTVPSPAGMWERDRGGHGTHTTSTIIGYRLAGALVDGVPATGVLDVDGVAPEATIIPVKIIGNGGFYHNSALAEALVYLARLKAGPLADKPMVINLSIGGSGSSIVRAALDYAIASGIIIVAAAGNNGDAGMSFPATHRPLISVAAAGVTWQYSTSDWWFARDVADPYDLSEYFVPTFSARALAGQELDVTAPGMRVSGPLQTNAAQLGYHLAGGTSVAAPHVSGIVALMAQKYPLLTNALAEAILRNSARELPPGCRTIVDPSATVPPEHCWGANATGAGLVSALGALAATPNAP